MEEDEQEWYTVAVAMLVTSPDADTATKIASAVADDITEFLRGKFPLDEFGVSVETQGRGQRGFSQFVVSDEVRDTDLDPLTGLANRRSAKDWLFEQLARALATDGKLAVAFLDIDNFKAFNDAYGNALGDQLLVEVAEEVNATVGSRDLAARLGGDEFMLGFAETGGSEAAARVDEVRERIAGRERWAGMTAAITISAGVADLDGLRRVRPPIDVRELFAAADEAMFDAKNRSGNCVAVFPRWDR